MQTFILGLALLGGLGVFGAFYGLAAPPLQLRRAQAGTVQAGLQVRLNRAGLGTTAGSFLLRGTLYGAVMAVIAYLASGSLVAGLPFFLGGYAFLWVQLEDQRNQRIAKYHNHLATGMDIIVNAWRITPSLSGALEAVARYGPGASVVANGAPDADSVAADVSSLLRALRTGATLRDALQQVADRRRSPIFDGLGIALLTAEEQGATAGEMLARQAQITRQQVNAFEEAMSRQRTSRSEVRNGTLGPWLILFLVRFLSTFTFLNAANAPADAMVPDSNVFFTTPVGMIVGLGAASLTVGMYVWAMRTAARGMRMERVPTEHGREAKA